MRKCPTCGKPVDWQDNPWRPFCSERCKLIDFDRWTTEDYRVPGRSVDPSTIQAPDEHDSETESDRTAEP